MEVAPEPMVGAHLPEIESGVDDVLAEFRLERLKLLVFLEPCAGLVRRQHVDAAAIPTGVAFRNGIFGVGTACTAQEVFPLGGFIERLSEISEIVVAKIIPVRRDIGCGLCVVSFAVNYGFYFHYFVWFVFCCCSSWFVKEQILKITIR